MTLHRHIIAFLTLLSCSVAAAELPNIHWAQEELINYHDSGSYMTELTAVDNDAMTYLANAVMHNTHHKKLAIVLDIDETALSNWTMVQDGFANLFPEAAAAYLRFEDPVLAPTLSLYHYAIDHGVSVFFITGRYHPDTTGTEKNLKQAGYTTWQQLILRNDHEKNLSAVTYKTAHRKAIVDAGYDIVMSVGDQWSDLKGGYADAVFKLPNPFYYID